MDIYLKCGSERIRTSGRGKPTTVFKTAAFNRSATLPFIHYIISYLSCFV